ncbi:hypothetical protein [Leifsonia sp. ZF2019]|uniref:hypothetical protein n=1 Tax=Leifsonia sp. ZF2019 TaxID=2781978 RepID=UPI001CBD01AA|nr:hypothetical protein [Leifsonia sp. ZF2019]
MSAGAIGWYFESVADQLARSVKLCAEVWTGDAADAAFDYLGRLVTATRSAGSAARTLEDRLGKVAQAVYGSCEELEGCFTTVVDCIGAAVASTAIGGATAETVVGPALAAFVDALLVARAFQAAKKATELTQETVASVRYAVDLMQAIGASGGVLSSVRIPLPGDS